MFYYKRSQVPAISFVLLGFFVMFCGCGSNSNIGQVNGIVTMDGDFLTGAVIAFHPTDGRASIGRTDATGSYNLTYIKNELGAIIGSHKVTVSTKVYASEGMDSKGNPTLDDGKPESMPRRYSNVSQTVLTAEVMSGSNQINFELSTH